MTATVSFNYYDPDHSSDLQVSGFQGIPGPGTYPVDVDTARLAETVDTCDEWPEFMHVRKAGPTIETGPTGQIWNLTGKLPARHRFALVDLGPTQEQPDAC